VTDCSSGDFISNEEVYVGNVTMGHISGHDLQNITKNGSGSKSCIEGTAYVSVDRIGKRHALCIALTGGNILGMAIRGDTQRVELSEASKKSDSPRE
jgi:hypothetical protein